MQVVAILVVVIGLFLVAACLFTVNKPKVDRKEEEVNKPVKTTEATGLKENKQKLGGWN